MDRQRDFTEYHRLSDKLRSLLQQYEALAHIHLSIDRENHTLLRDIRCLEDQAAAGLHNETSASGESLDGMKTKHNDLDEEKIAIREEYQVFRWQLARFREEMAGVRREIQELRNYHSRALHP